MKRELAIFIVGVGLIGGCGTESLHSDEEFTRRDSEAVTVSRRDFVGAVTVAEGYFGSWQRGVFCNEGMWATGFKLRVEPDQSGGDDTALNSVALFCSSDDGEEWITSHDGLWGTWGLPAYCPAGRKLMGARLRLETPQDGGDDTAANDVMFKCARSPEPLVAGNGMGYGDWTSEWGSCRSGSAVCGLSIRFEDDQHGRDDTAMNGLSLHCCSTP